MKPSGARLCNTGKTHSIVLKKSEKKCKDKPHHEHQQQSESCEVIWSYVCVDEKGIYVHVQARVYFYAS